MEFFLNSAFSLVNDRHFRELPPSQMPNSSSSLYHVILGLGLPLVLHFSVIEIPSLAITTGGKLRTDGFLGSTKCKNKLNDIIRHCYFSGKKNSILTSFGLQLVVFLL